MTIDFMTRLILAAGIGQLLAERTGYGQPDDGE